MTSESLRFLADESCDFSVVRYLRAEGYDVSAVCETMQRSVDHEVIERAYQEKRILITEDKDFGGLVFVSHMDSNGVILIRYPGSARSELPQVIGKFVREHSQDIVGTFVVVQPGQIRISHAT
jgi:predicted nuclease of predicted toxin-antitoxin system